MMGPSLQVLKGCSRGTGVEGEGGCGVCEARECQGRGAAAVQGGWHAIESYGLLTESPLLLRCYKSEQLESEQRKACKLGTVYRIFQRAREYLKKRATRAT